jgi:alginate O-acetyltransferase complex protein AlgJ
MLTIVFLATIVLVPIVENVGDLRANVAARRALTAQGVPVQALPGRRPKSFDILNVLPSWHQITAARSAGDLVALIPAPWQFRLYEDSLVLTSTAGKLLRPWTQWVLTGWLGVGNEKVDIGRNGWLYYSDGVQYVTGPGFLDRAQLNRRLSNGYKQPDPRKAIFQFFDELRAAGVSLVVMPIPDKAMIHLKPYSSLAVLGAHPPQNLSWDEFSRDLREHGVPLLDIGQEMFEKDAAGKDMFLRSDSHWNPAGADLAARLLADFLASDLDLPTGAPVSFRHERFAFQKPGDLAPLLGLSASRLPLVSPPEQLNVERVIGPEGTLWREDALSPIFVIGDSFLEIYETETAGLAEQLSYYLKRTVDAKASHNWGEYGAREALGKTLEDVRKAAMGRRVIVWEFAIRSLAVNDWKLLE